MSTFAYAYTYQNGYGKAQRGFSTLTGAVRHLRRSIEKDANLSHSEAKPVAREAARALGGQITAHGATVLIVREEA